MHYYLYVAAQRLVCWIEQHYYVTLFPAAARRHINSKKTWKTILSCSAATPITFLNSLGLDIQDIKNFRSPRKLK
jgi:hypothetical protein